MIDDMTTDFRSGYVSIVGRPNVGKSTLLNTILGEKITIVTPKPQTTRNRIVGIKTLPHAQIIFIDTPGIHRPKHMLGETMVKTSLRALSEVDVILFMVEPREPTRGDRAVIDILKKVTIPVIDIYKDYGIFPEIIPLSALQQDGANIIISKICEYLHEGPQYYPGDLITDQIERFMVSEIVREKIMDMTGRAGRRTCVNSLQYLC